jgi:hypothetical protein
MFLDKDGTTDNVQQHNICTYRMFLNKISDKLVSYTITINNYA